MLIYIFSDETEPKQHFKKFYLEALEKVIGFIQDRFDQPSYQTFKHLETLILSAANGQGYDDSLQHVLEFYAGDFDEDSLKTQLRLLGQEVFDIDEKQILHLTIHCASHAFRSCHC